MNDTNAPVGRTKRMLNWLREHGHKLVKYTITFLIIDSVGQWICWYFDARYGGLAVYVAITCGFMIGMITGTNGWLPPYSRKTCCDFDDVESALDHVREASVAFSKRRDADLRSGLN
jgi:hypothetical protein